MRCNASGGISVLDLGHFTSAVQFGFISVTFLFAFSGVADRFSAGRERKRHDQRGKHGPDQGNCAHGDVFRNG
jgi:hypothetical protein